jgi:hypothetical protein
MFNITVYPTIPLSGRSSEMVPLNIFRFQSECGIKNAPSGSRLHPGWIGNGDVLFKVQMGRIHRINKR